jgi:hypothetical protein
MLFCASLTEQAHAYLDGGWDDIQMSMVKEIQAVQSKIKETLTEMKRRVI